MDTIDFFIFDVATKQFNLGKLVKRLYVDNINYPHATTK